MALSLSKDANYVGKAPVNVANQNQCVNKGVPPPYAKHTKNKCNQGIWSEYGHVHYPRVVI